jgi:hypothetical protein
VWSTADADGEQDIYSELFAYLPPTEYPTNEHDQMYGCDHNENDQ